MSYSEEIIRKAMLNQDAQLNAVDNWARIANTLDQSKKRKAFYWPWFCLALVAVGGGLYYTFQYEKPIKNAQSETLIDQALVTVTDIQNTPKKPNVLANSKTQPTLNKQNIANGAVNITKKGVVTASKDGNQITNQSGNAPNYSIYLNNTSAKNEQENSSEPNSHSNHKVFIINTLDYVPKLTYPKRSIGFKIQPLAKKQKKSHFINTLEVRFAHSRGLVAHQLDYFNEGIAQFASPVPYRPMQSTGIEVSYPLFNNWHIRSGILSGQQRFKIIQPSGSEGEYFQYNLSFPIMIEYRWNSSKISPFIAFGGYYNQYDLDGFGGSRSTIDGNGYNYSVNKANGISGALEAGAAFRILKQKFSISLEANLSNVTLFEADYITFEEGQADVVVGESSASGSFISLKARYHFELFKKTAERFESKAKQASYANHFGVELGGASRFYSFFYQRFLLQKSAFKLAIRQGIGYVPNYNEGGFIAAPADDIKLMGLFLPTSVLGYIGQNQLYLSVGISNTFVRGPWRYPDLNPGEFGWFAAQTAILGVRYEHKKWAFEAQMNGIIAVEAGELNFEGFGGISISRGF